jgi:hypothetical protein
MAQATTKASSNKLGSLISPVGSALFVSAPAASSFDPNKQEASIILSAEDHATMMAQIDGLIAAYEGALVVAKDKLKYPFKNVEDKEGNETGEFLWKAKTSVQYPSKFFDANGQGFKPAPGFTVANRSKIRLAVSAEIVSTSLYRGLVLRLNAIKIISSTPWAGGTDPFSGVTDEGDFAYDSQTVVADAPDTDWVD